MTVETLKTGYMLIVLNEKKFDGIFSLPKIKGEVWTRCEPDPEATVLIFQYLKDAKAMRKYYRSIGYMCGEKIYKVVFEEREGKWQTKQIL